VSLLKSQGHPYADFYPIWRVWAEIDVVRRRMNRELAQQTVSRYIAGVASRPQNKKSARKASETLQKYIQGLSDG